MQFVTLLLQNVFSLLESEKCSVLCTCCLPACLSVCQSVSQQAVRFPMLWVDCGFFFFLKVLFKGQFFKISVKSNLLNFVLVLSHMFLMSR